MPRFHYRPLSGVPLPHPGRAGRPACGAVAVLRGSACRLNFQTVVTAPREALVVNENVVIFVNGNRTPPVEFPFALRHRIHGTGNKREIFLANRDQNLELPIICKRIVTRRRGCRFCRLRKTLAIGRKVLYRRKTLQGNLLDWCWGRIGSASRCSRVPIPRTHSFRCLFEGLNIVGGI